MKVLGERKKKKKKNKKKKKKQAKIKFGQIVRIIFRK